MASADGEEVKLAKVASKYFSSLSVCPTDVHLSDSDSIGFFSCVQNFLDFFFFLVVVGFFEGGGEEGLKMK